jgi:hypothetical protein
LLAGQNLSAVEIAAIGDGIEMISLNNLLRLRRHFDKL